MRSCICEVLYWLSYAVLITPAERNSGAHYSSCREAAVQIVGRGVTRQLFLLTFIGIYWMRFSGVFKLVQYWMFLHDLSSDLHHTDHVVQQAPGFHSLIGSNRLASLCVGLCYVLVCAMNWSVLCVCLCYVLVYAMCWTMLCVGMCYM